MDLEVAPKVEPLIAAVRANMRTLTLADGPGAGRRRVISKAEPKRCGNEGAGE